MVVCSYQRSVFLFLGSDSRDRLGVYAALAAAVNPYLWLIIMPWFGSNSSHIDLLVKLWPDAI